MSPVANMKPGAKSSICVSPRDAIFPQTIIRELNKEWSSQGSN